MDADDQRVLQTLAAFYENLHEQLCSKGEFCSAHQSAAGIIDAVRRQIDQEITDEINSDPLEAARLRGARQRIWERVEDVEDDGPIEEVRVAFERAVRHLTVAPPPSSPAESRALGSWRERHETEVRRIAERLVNDHAAILQRLRDTDMYNEAMQAAAAAEAQDQREKDGAVITHRRTCNLVALRPDLHGSSALVCSCDYWQRTREQAAAAKEDA